MTKAIPTEIQRIHADLLIRSCLETLMNLGYQFKAFLSSNYSNKIVTLLLRVRNCSIFVQYCSISELLLHGENVPGFKGFINILGHINDAVRRNNQKKLNLRYFPSFFKPVCIVCENLHRKRPAILMQILFKLILN